jgi:hypothetical protein
MVGKYWVYLPSIPLLRSLFYRIYLGILGKILSRYFFFSRNYGMVVEGYTAY